MPFATVRVQNVRTLFAVPPTGFAVPSVNETANVGSVSTNRFGLGSGPVGFFPLSSIDFGHSAVMSAAGARSKVGAAWTSKVTM